MRRSARFFLVIFSLFASGAMATAPKKAPQVTASNPAAVKTPAKSVVAYWANAKEHLAKREYLEAASELERLVTDHPSESDARPIGAWFYWEASKRLTGAERSKLEKKAEAFILAGHAGNETSWFYNRELGDFYRLRVGSTTKSHDYYQKAVEHFASASKVQKAALLDRVARSAEELGRKGDAVLASCRALEFDAEDKMAKNRILALSGNCTRKGVNLKLEGVNAADPESPKSHEGSSH
ncbi:MAG TPA: hypothetical protein VM901_01345 [Bdellovibrionota bacterium]|nr:hypothetical protein [Bdellovibrionota bacterium]